MGYACGSFMGGLPSFNFSNNGNTEIEDNSLALSKLFQIEGEKLLGNYNALTGNVEEISIGNNLQFDSGVLKLKKSGIAFPEEPANIALPVANSSILLNGLATIQGDNNYITFTGDGASIQFQQDNQFIQLQGLTNYLQLGNTKYYGTNFDYEFTLPSADGLANQSLITDSNGVLSFGYPLIEDGSITNSKLADLSVSTAKLQDNSISSAKLQNDSVTYYKIPENLITGYHLANNSVGNASIIGGVITGDKLSGHTLTFQKVQQILQNEILGRIDAGSGIIQRLTPSEVRSIIGLTDNVANGYAKLDGDAKLPTSILPAIAVSEVFVVADNTARDALIVEEGDFAKVTGTGLTFIYDGSSWVEITSSSDVLMVNGQTGNVVLTTTHINEGTNLYWTSLRFDNAFSAKTTDDLTEGSTNKYYSETLFDTSLSGKSTTDLTEGTNLYWTSGRFDTAFSGKTTDDLTEGVTNLYYAEDLFDDSFSGKTTDELTEGTTNLYHKNYVIEEFTSNAVLVFGDICRLEVASARMIKADNSAYVQANGLLGICLETSLNGGETGRFLIYGVYSGISTIAASTGEEIYLGDSGGSGTVTEPSATGKIVRSIGYCIDGASDTIFFNPSSFIYEVA